MLRILLIDDDSLFRKMLHATLNDQGHVVSEASDGQEGIALYESELFDLVITDLIMSGKEGIETIRDLRRKHPEVKIIAMSGGGRQSADSYLKIALTMGARRVLAKPFSGEELKKAIHEVLTT